MYSHQAGIAEWVYNISVSNGTSTWVVDNSDLIEQLSDECDRAIANAALQETIGLADADAQTNTAAWTQLFSNTLDELGRVVREQSIEKAGAGGAIVYRATDSYRYDGLDRIIEYSNQNLLISFVRFLPNDQERNGCMADEIVDQSRSKYA